MELVSGVGGRFKVKGSNGKVRKIGMKALSYRNLVTGKFDD